MHPSVNFASTKDDPAIFANTEEELLPYILFCVVDVFIGGLLEDDFDEILIESIAVAEHNQPSVEKNGFLEDKEVAAVTKNLQSVNLAEQSEPFMEKNRLLENELDKEVAAVTKNAQAIANEKYQLFLEFYQISSSRLSCMIFHGNIFVTVSSSSGVANVALNGVMTASAVGQVSSRHLGQVQHYKKIRRPPALFAKETDENILARRTKDIQKGYNCEAYKHYLNAVPKDARIKGVHPVTPTKELKFSRRSWDAQVRLWRRNIHSAVRNLGLEYHEVIDEQPNFDEEKSSDFYGGKRRRHRLLPAITIIRHSARIVILSFVSCRIGCLMLVSIENFPIYSKQQL
ncbi:Oocyte-specific histone RNA stem-loop-binding protein 2 [Trichinella spiralis]|uniref:Oocyte-specific histone RNA stem-loop-binding protein 2 n=1 Tax=Trichinella spiralis TaxID=6334 RepID=A0A0V1AXT5_TRISP|nr:Oocyte-specific histone RNA stem-loop-binding protein 2 [Trichinella spiralis]